MHMRLPEVYCDAKQAIEDSLEGGTTRLLKGRYGSLAVNACNVMHFHIKDTDDPEGNATLELLITYKERRINKYEKFEEVQQTQTLKILTTKGDKLWPYSMIIKVWEGNYPSGVAVNEDTGVIYFVNLRMSGLELVEFSKFTDKQLEAFKEDLNDEAPYRIGLDEDAMFQHISGNEGNKKLKETLFIEFDCGVKIRVTSNLTEVL